MAVYVDTPMVLRHQQRWSHLMADTLPELHAFAARLGLPRRAFQNKRSGAHYDLTLPMREHALRLGAISLSRRDDREKLKAVIACARQQAHAAAGVSG